MAHPQDIALRLREDAVTGKTSAKRSRQAPRVEVDFILSRE